MKNSAFTKKIFTFFLLVTPILFFSHYKISQLDFRFGDGNAYIYIAYAIREGLIPYKDFFLADPPVLVIFLLLFSFIFEKNFLLFQTIPFCLEIGTTILLTLIVKEWKNPFYIFVPFLYLLSFIVLSTSDYLTGVQLTVFFWTLGVYLWIKKRPYISGVFWSLAILTKLYAIPLFVGFLIGIFLYKKTDDLKKIILGSFITGCTIMFPFLFFSFFNIIDHLIIHQFNRPHGIPKLNIFRFFITKDLPLLVLSGVGMVTHKKMYLLLPFLLTLMFFILFRDIYYLYLNSLTPFIVIFSVMGLYKIWQVPEYGKPAITLILGFLLCFTWYSFSIYNENFNKQGTFTNINEVSNYIVTLNPTTPLYGSHEVAPLVGLFTHKKLFLNHIDTNTQAFGSSALNKKEISNKAVESGIYLLIKSIQRPEVGVSNEPIYEGFFEKDVFNKYCTLKRSFPFESIELENYVSIYECKK